METKPLSRAERALVGGLRRVFTNLRKMDIGPHDRVILRFHFRDGGRTLHRFEITWVALTPKGQEEEEWGDSASLDMRGLTGP